MSYRLALSLKKFITQIDSAFPARSKISDGWIGDAKHASRTSDHNPWVKDAKGVGVVRAYDVTHDPDNGVDCHQLAEELRVSKDPRIKYVIWNSQIFSSLVSPWRWRRYKGSNKHTKHLHLSVNSGQGLYDSLRLWRIALNGDKEFNFFESAYEIQLGDNGAAVKQLQEKLFKLGYLPKDGIDGDFGKGTKKAVIEFQQTNGLEADGIVGSKTKKVILESEKRFETGSVVNHSSESKAENLAAVKDLKPSNENSTNAAIKPCTSNQSQTPKTGGE